MCTSYKSYNNYIVFDLLHKINIVKCIGINYAGFL